MAEGANIWAAIATESRLLVLASVDCPRAPIGLLAPLDAGERGGMSKWAHTLTVGRRCERRSHEIKEV